MCSYDKKSHNLLYFVLFVTFMYISVRPERQCKGITYNVHVLLRKAKHCDILHD